MSRLAYSAFDAQSDIAGALQIWMYGMNKLSKRLEQLESEIESGIRSVGKALMEIRDSKAYLDHHNTFEEYCKERWGFTDRHARELISAETVRAKIGTFVPVETLKTEHLLAISSVPANKQGQVAASVLAECEEQNRKPTTKDFKAAAKEFVQPKADPKPEPRQAEPEAAKEPDVWEDVNHIETDPEPDSWEDVEDTPEPQAKPEQAETPQALQAPIQAVATQLTGMLKELKRLSDCTGGEWRDVSDLETQIKQLSYSIRQSIYWIDCMDCGGKGCKTCRQLGWLSLDRKKHLTQAQKDAVGL